MQRRDGAPARAALRILFVMREFPMPSHTFILDQVRGLLERGHGVEILARRPSADARLHADVEAYGIEERTHYAERPARNVFARLVRARRLARRSTPAARERIRRSTSLVRGGVPAWARKHVFDAAALGDAAPFDIVHAHFGLTCVRAARLLRTRVLAAPLIASFHGHDVTSFKNRRRRRLYPRLFREAARLTAPSAFVRTLLEGLGCPRAKIEVLPVGIDLARFPMTPRAPPAQGPIRLLTVARLEEQKGIPCALAAVARLAPEHPRLHYAVVGEGAHRSAIEARIRDLGLGERVRLLGACSHEDVRTLCARAHLYVQPSQVSRRGNREALSTSVLEAQASGLPVVATRVGGLPEAVADGRSGSLVAPGDPAALAARLGALLERPETWADLGRAGRAHVEAHYDQSVMLDRQVALYRSVLGREQA